jgi:uncharacterized repeat protein (TIGR03833 family)
MKKVYYKEGENHYEVDTEKRKTTRISKEDYENKRSLKKPSVGDIIKIIIKPYAEGKTVCGVVKRVLTNKKIHTRGHKVELMDGTIGRTVKILNSKN